MYEYKFVKIDLKGILPPKSPVEDYHKIIEENAIEGWRLVQIFAPVVSAGPFAPYYELIFEKEKYKLNCNIWIEDKCKKLMVSKLGIY